MRQLLRLPRILHGTVLRVARHDCLNLAQSTAYSAMVSLFPALIVAAAVVSLLPDTTPLRFQLSAFFDRILPPDVSPLLEGYFVDSPHGPRSSHALIVAFIVSLTGASSVIATLMEGVRRANALPTACWTLWQRRPRALLLFPLTLASPTSNSFQAVAPKQPPARLEWPRRSKNQRSYHRCPRW